MITSAFPLLFIIGSIAALAVTGNLFSSSPFVIAAQAAAVGLSIWARRAFRQDTFRVTAVPAGSSIIRHGPYRVIRHPMYSAALLFIWTAVVSHLSVLTLAIGIACTGLAVARVFAEEQLLRARFVEYPDYARSTNALIPFVF
jgi:protein-S-isoprenylcysteine O-methyltransferase Ste14